MSKNREPNKANYKKLKEEVHEACLSEEGLKDFPFPDKKLTMFPKAEHINNSVIRASLDAIVEEKGQEVVPIINGTVNNIYLKMTPSEFINNLFHNGDFHNEDIYRLKSNENLNLKKFDKMPFDYQKLGIDGEWMSYEAYQIFNWICEKISNNDNFLMDANKKGTKKDKRIERSLRFKSTPELAFKIIVPEMARNYNHTINLKPLEVESGRTLYELTVKEEFYRRSWKNWENFRRGEEATIGKLLYVPTIFGHENVSYKIHQMMKDGAKSGIYEIKYEKDGFSRFKDNTYKKIWGYTLGGLTILKQQITEAREATRGEAIKKIEAQKSAKIAQEKTIEAEISAENERETAKDLKVAYQDLKVSETKEKGMNEKLLIAYDNQEKSSKEKLELQKALAKTERLNNLSVLVGGAAHDFNNILGSILGYPDLNAFLLEDSAKELGILKNIDSKLKTYLSRSEYDKSKAEELFKEIESERNEIYEKMHKKLRQCLDNENNVAIAGRRGKDISENLMSFARGEQTPKTKMNLNGLIEDYKGNSAFKHIKFHQDLGPELRDIFASKSQIDQTLLNLYLNASYAMKDSAEKELYVQTKNVLLDEKFIDANDIKKTGEYNLLSIRDTGHGMNKETMDKIFETLFTTKKNGEGTGLGLANVKGIITDHNGAITVESEPGNGTQFNIYLPKLGLYPINEEGNLKF